jgi:hypothetical protein
MSDRKLKLDLGALHVESFAPATAEIVRGTVHGHWSNGTYCYNTCNCANDSVPGYASCGTTCQEPTNCFSYCTNENCVESNYWTCGQTCGCNASGATCGASCGCPPATSIEAGCPEM